MSYLYVRYEMKKLELFGLFENCLKCINFDKFERNKNCQLTIEKERFGRIAKAHETFDFFVLDELKFGISKRIYRVNGNSFSLVEDDEIEENEYPEIKTISSKLFYDSFEDRLEKYENFFGDFVNEDDFESFA